MAMEERMMVLKMLQEGKITAEDAGRLLEALEPADGRARKAVQPSWPPFVSGLERLPELLERVPDVVERALTQQGRFGFGLLGLGSGFTFEDTLEQVLEPGEGPVQVELEGSNGRIVLRAHAEPKVRVVLSKQVRAGNRAEAEKRARELAEVAWGARTLRVRHKPSAWLQTGSLGLEVWLPQSELCHAEVTTSNGRITAEGIRFAGGRLTTSNGRIELLHCAGKAPEIRTSNGRIVAEGLRGSLAARTSNGRIEVRPAEDPFDGEEEIAYDLTTSNGPIRIKLQPQPGVGYDLELATTLGRVRTDFDRGAMEQVRASKERFVGRSVGYAGCAKRWRIHATTSNGSVTVGAQQDDD